MLIYELILMVFSPFCITFLNMVNILKVDYGIGMVPNPYPVKMEIFC